MTKIINYGISETLKGLFAQLKETPGQSGVKYHHKDVDKIAQDIVCRNYGSVCYELSFLCWAVVNHPSYVVSPLLEYFWLAEDISPKQFRRIFAQPIQCSSGQIHMADDFLQLQIDAPQGHTEFAISPTRVSTLAVLLEFIVYIDPSQLNKIEVQLRGASVQQIKQLSSQLQKLIYAYLKEHMPEASTQERFRAIDDWLSLHHIKVQQITDQNVLDFWLNPPARPSYIKYSTALDDLLDAVTAIEVVENTFNSDYALSLGNNSEQGEFNPDWVQNSCFEHTNNTEDFAWLCLSPKFLTATQYQPIKNIVGYGKLSQQLPLSFLRLAVFGNWQSVLVQAKRKSAQALAEKLSQAPAQHYQASAEDIRQSLCHCINMQQIIGYIFYALESPLVMGIMLRYLSATSYDKLHQKMREYLDNSPLSEQTIFLHFREWVSHQPEAEAWLTNASKAFKINNKDGFKSVPDVAKIDTYQAGAEALLLCQQTVEGYLSALNKITNNNALSAIYRSDLCIFSTRFKQIYGASDG